MGRNKDQRSELSSARLRGNELCRKKENVEIMQRFHVASVWLFYPSPSPVSPKPGGGGGESRCVPLPAAVPARDVPSWFQWPGPARVGCT